MKKTVVFALVMTALIFVGGFVWANGCGATCKEKCTDQCQKTTCCSR